MPYEEDNDLQNHVSDEREHALQIANAALLLGLGAATAISLARLALLVTTELVSTIAGTAKASDPNTTFITSLIGILTPLAFLFICAKHWAEQKHRDQPTININLIFLNMPGGLPNAQNGSGTAPQQPNQANPR